MKHLHYFCFTASPATKLAILIAPLLLAGSVTATAASTTDITRAELTPTIALYQTVDNSTEPACSFDLPALGNPLPMKRLPKKECPEPIDPHSIRIHNMPIKSKVLLVDSADCAKEGHAWIELDTSRANASLEKMGIDKIWTYPGSPEKPGYVYNKGDDNNMPSSGFRVIGKGNPIKQGELACIVVNIPKRNM